MHDEGGVGVLCKYLGVHKWKSYMFVCIDMWWGLLVLNLASLSAMSLPRIFDYAQIF